MLIYEGCVMIWNIALSFMNENFNAQIIKAFSAAVSLMEMVQIQDHTLRCNMHLVLAKHDYFQDNLQKADIHVRKALQLDPSLSLAKLKEKNIKIEAEEDLSLH